MLWYLYYLLLAFQRILLDYYPATMSRYFFSISKDAVFLLAADGTVYVAQDLSKEYSQTFTGIQLCIADRRDSGICITLTITLCEYVYLLKVVKVLTKINGNWCI